MKKYENLDQMHLVKNPTAQSLSKSSNSYYTPHHGIFQHGNNIRVVFNASAKAFNHNSLNDTLYSGPSLQSNITDVIIRWRMKRFVYAADISKMYR